MMMRPQAGSALDLPLGFILVRTQENGERVIL